MLPALRELLSDIDRFTRYVSGLSLRGYQLEVARAVINSICAGQGRSFVVLFPRQSGKNELQAQLETYLLLLLCGTEAEIVKISPTWKPQSLNAMRRLERVLRNNRLAGLVPDGKGQGWKKESGYIYRVGRARIFFFSGAPEAHIVGATASTLLEIDEAQDVGPLKYDKDIAPMAASTNATRILFGTAWTAHTLLARELRAARQAEQRDGLRRVFRLTAEDVAREVPAYGRYVAEQVERLGRNHPLVRTQYFSEEIDAQGGLFPPERRALMQGDHPPRSTPAPGELYAFLLDVAGEESGQAVGAAEANPRRDSTALTVAAVDLSGLDDPGLRAPRYRVVMRRTWTGLSQTALYGQIHALADTWQPRKLVVDATGIGAGLASFLEKSLPGRVVPFVFTAESKSRLGWSFLALCDTGRFKDYRAQPPCPLAELFWRQAGGCEYEVRPGPGQVLRWSVPEAARDPLTGELLHDDLLISAALCAVLDEQPWPRGGASVLVARADPLAEIDREGF